MKRNESDNKDIPVSQYIGPLCDFRYLNDLVNGKTNLIIDIIDVFLKQIPEDLQGISIAIANVDYKTIRSYTHTMRSSVSIMGISLLQHVLIEMENIGKAEIGIEKIKLLNVKLNEICVKAIAEIETERLKYILPK